MKYANEVRKLQDRFPRKPLYNIFTFFKDGVYTEGRGSKGRTYSREEWFNRIKDLSKKYLLHGFILMTTEQQQNYTKEDEMTNGFYIEIPNIGL